MLLYKLLTEVQLEIEFSAGKKSYADLRAKLPNTMEDIHLEMEIDNCSTIQMMMNTIDSSVQDHLGIKYVTEQYPRLAKELEDEMNKYIGSLPLEGVIGVANTSRTA